MPKFRYIVVNKENRQLSGVVDAPSLDVAQNDLKELGFSIVSIEKAEEKKQSKEGTTFEFNGIDKQKKNITGTIVADDRYSAFKRLITEYDLDVRYIVNQDLPKKEKEKQKKEGVISLMKEYQKEVQKNTQKFHKEKIKKIDRNFEREKALVMRQVDFVLKKVSKAIDTFGDDLNPQSKQRIKDFVNKILRLKNTTNLEYLKSTCQDLLKYLQRAEIFTSKKSRLGEKLKLYTDTQEMINTIQRGKDFGIYEDLQSQIERWQSEHIKGKKKIPLGDKITNIFYTIILKFISESKDIRIIKKKISNLNRDLKQYYQIVLKSKDEEYKKAASKSIKQLRDKKKELKQTLRVLRKNEKKAMNAQGELTGLEKVISVINGLSGWLLFYYLVYYFIAELIIYKDLLYTGSDIPTLFFLFNSGLVKYILPLIFLLHVATSIKLNFFKKNAVAGIIIFPVFALASLVIVFNF
ncbi:hypothetical protein GF369_04200 [Candidatus Peregrinibacteria bacterium]|nr:hypothetical protein [Candidatus Peregrinibacteria bacterium]